MNLITEKNCNTKNIRIGFALFVLMAMALLFPFATSSHAITITGTETVTTNSSASYSTADCSGTVSWNVTGTGASISSNGVLTAGPASCGGITVTAHCSDGSIATKTARVTNAGQWVIVDQCRCCFYEPYCGACGITVIEGRYKFWNNVVYSNTPLTPRPDEPRCGNIPASGCKGCTKYNHCMSYDPYNVPPCPISSYSSASTKWEWQCPSCTNGQSISCYTGTGGTQGVGVCKAGTQTCVNGQWGACVGEVLPQAEICGDGKDNNCNGQIDEGCAVCEDKDGDGYYAYNAVSCPQGNDCNDNDATIYPGVTEKCDGKDNNCDGQVDEGCCGYTIPNLPPEIIKQCKPSWKSMPYDLTNSTICSQGCAMASLTMLMKQQGCNVDLLSVNNCSQCFGSSGAVDWSKVLNIFCSNAKYLASASKNVASYGKPHVPIPKDFVLEVNEGLKNGYLYLLKVGSPRSPDGYRQHFVFVIGTTDDCKGLKVYDPAVGEKVYYYYKGFRKFKGI